MDVLYTFGPVILDALILFGIFFFIWRAFQRRTNYKDQMLQQLITKNKELEEKVSQLLEKGNMEDN
jgi:hypothetical protein